LLFIAALSSAAISQVRRSGPPIVRGPAPAPSIKVVPIKDPLNDFAKKGLPDPYILGGIPGPALARKAAALIMKNDENSLSVLIGALQTAGFHIIDEKQKILFKPTNPNGTAFFDYEVAGMLRSSNLGFVTSLEKIATIIKGKSQKLKNIDMAGRMLADINAQRASKDSSNQFLAELIVALGNGISTPRSDLNMIQASLVERRFLGDLVATYEEMSGGVSLYHQKSPYDPAGVMFVKTRFNGMPSVFVSQHTPDDDSPCPAIDKAAEAQGYNKKGGKILKFFGILPEGSDTGVLKEAADGVELANTIMSYLKLIAANLFIEIEVDIPNPPIKRTKSARQIDRGEERTITATFKRYFPNSAQINCVAKVIKMATGAELDVPEEGLLKDVPVKWEPLDNADKSPLYVDALDRNNVYTQTTDNAGQNKIKATGKEQKKDLTHIPVTSVPKTDRWKVSVATEKMDAGTDIPKIIWGSLDLKSGSIIGYLIGVVPDILAKMALKSYQVNIPVKDWEPCSEDWSGTVQYTRNLRNTVVIKSDHKPGMNSAGDGVKTTDYHEDVQITLNPRTAEEIAAKAPKKNADFDVYGYYTTKFEGVREKDPCCGSTEGSFTTAFVSGTDITFQANYPYAFGMYFSGGDNDYQLGFTLDTGHVKTKVHDYERIDQSTCNLEKGHDRNTESTTWIHSALTNGRYPTMYLSDGVELSGSKTYQDADGSTISWEWDLTRCNQPRK